MIEIYITPKMSLKIDHLSMDYGRWRSLNTEENYNSLDSIFDGILRDLDCTREYTSGRPMMTSFSVYYNRLSEYMYWLLKLDNYEVYNMYLDKLIQRHIDNVIFENEHPYIKPVNKSSSKLSWCRQETIDLFTGLTTYIYQNLKTGEYIRSDNPDLLKELNERKKKKCSFKDNKERIRKTNKLEIGLGDDEKTIFNGEKNRLSVEDIIKVATFKF